MSITFGGSTNCTMKILTSKTQVDVELNQTTPNTPFSPINETLPTLFSLADPTNFCDKVDFDLVYADFSVTPPLLFEADPSDVQLNNDTVLVNTTESRRLAFGIRARSPSAETAVILFNVTVGTPSACQIDFIAPQKSINLTLNLTTAAPFTQLNISREMALSANDTCGRVDYILIQGFLNHTTGVVETGLADPSVVSFDAINQSLITVNTTENRLIQFSLVTKSPAAMLPGIVHFAI